MYRTQVIVAGAIMVVVPIVLAYMTFGYWVFRGKTRPSAGATEL